MSGVHLCGGSEHYLAEATNGHVAATVSSGTAGSESAQAIVPKGAWTAAFTRVRKKGSLDVCVEADVAILTTGDETESTISRVKAVEGRYPNIADVVPKAAAQAAVRVKVSRLIALLKVAMAVEPHVWIELRDSAPIVLRCENDAQRFLGLLMPEV
jgi:DNA polymerase III sliding clamp (beta) subunit (PCNA family)